MLIILESIAISLLKYSSKNNNKFYILSGICYILIVYILYHLFKVEKVVTSFALWNIGAILFAYIISTFIFKEKVKISFNNVRSAVANLNTFVQEHIVGMNIVQIFGNEKKEYEKFEKINELHLKANLKAVLYYSIYFPVMELFTSIGLGLLIWYGSGQLFMEEVTLGVLIAFIMYLQLFFRPIRSIADRFNTLQMGVVSSKRIFDLLDKSESIKSKNLITNNNIEGKVEFKNVWFAYNKNDFVLKNISFKIDKGQSVGFVGATGSGKTSIINLINRFYDFQRGNILIDGEDIIDYNISSLRNNLGLVSQDVFLFSDSIYNNITLFNDSISEEEVWNAVRRVGAEKFIDNLPNKLQFDVKERGGSLSVGQRQLISCIRIMLYDPKIILLDEATSSIDSESEIMIQNAITEILKNRTSIVVAHRLSTIKEVDKIIVIDSGEIKEVGSHTNLLKENGFYRKLYEMQYENIVN